MKMYVIESANLQINSLIISSKYLFAADSFFLRHLFCFGPRGSIKFSVHPADVQGKISLNTVSA